VRPNLTPIFTVNTDFAQVEADEEHVNSRASICSSGEAAVLSRERRRSSSRCAPAGRPVLLAGIGLSATGSSGVPMTSSAALACPAKSALQHRVLNMLADSASPNGRESPDGRQQLRRRSRAREWADQTSAPISSTRRHGAGPADDYNRAMCGRGAAVTKNSKLFCGATCVRRRRPASSCSQLREQSRGVSGGYHAGGRERTARVLVTCSAASTP